MRKTLFPLLVCFVLSLTLFSFVNAGNKKVVLPTASVKELANATGLRVTNNSNSTKAAAAALYDKLQLADLGLSPEPMELAYRGLEALRKRGVLNNANIITVVDFSQSSHKKRMYIIDVKNEKVLFNTWVAHGRNSGEDYAQKFSNIPESLQSSLGFYVTKNIYFGKHGLSLKLDGQERGWNDLAEERDVVVHGADYVGEHRLGSPYMGRSFGCPAVPQEQANKIIDLIKNGTCLFIYHPNQSYLHGSKILNG